MNPVEKGTSILTSKPFAFNLNSEYRTERCDHCFGSGKLSKCTGCNYVYYCGKTCQKDSWKSIHKFECKSLKKFFPEILPDYARLLARIIITLKEGKNRNGKDEELEREYYGGNQSRMFQDLMSHKEEMEREEAEILHFESMCMLLKRFLGPKYFPNDMDFEKLFEIYGKMYINSFDIDDVNFFTLGCGIYLAVSSIDHSCEPNAQAIFQGTTVIIRTLKDFPNFEFSQVRISYIDLLQTVNERKKTLQKHYYFECNCPSCVNPELKYTAAACQNSSCTNLCSATDKQCSACGHEFPSDFASIYAQVDEFIVKCKKILENCEDWDFAQKCLKEQAGVLHPLNPHYVSIAYAAYHAAAECGYFKEAEILCKRAIEGLLKYYDEYTAAAGHMYLELGKIQLNLDKVHEASISAEKAKSILTVSHGAEHSIFKNDLYPVLFQIQMDKLRL